MSLLRQAMWRCLLLWNILPNCFSKVLLSLFLHQFSILSKIWIHHLIQLSLHFLLACLRQTLLEVGSIWLMTGEWIKLIHSWLASLVTCFNPGVLNISQWVCEFCEIMLRILYLKSCILPVSPQLSLASQRVSDFSYWPQERSENILIF